MGDWAGDHYTGWAARLAAQHGCAAVDYWLEDFELVHETEKAYLVRDDQDNEEWLPKSQMWFDERDGVKELHVEGWLVEKGGKKLNWREVYD